jgi:two-component system chemotaxis response regulator CheB
VPRFRCRTGHEFSPESLLAEQSEHVERALWAALRALEEKAAMLRRMAGRSGERGHHVVSHRLEWRAEATVQEALAIRTLLDDVEHDEAALDEQPVEQ